MLEPELAPMLEHPASAASSVETIKVFIEHFLSKVKILPI
jgi:hypothetical protein